MTWQEQFNKEFGGAFYNEDYDLEPLIERFISTEIIAKLIDEFQLPDEGHYGVEETKRVQEDLKELKQQLKDKWL